MCVLKTMNRASFTIPKRKKNAPLTYLQNTSQRRICRTVHDVRLVHPALWAKLPILHYLLLFAILDLGARIKFLTKAPHILTVGSTC